jgi:hypothetical protein
MLIKVQTLSLTLINKFEEGFWGFGVLGFWGFGVLGAWSQRAAIDRAAGEPVPAAEWLYRLVVTQPTSQPEA